MTRLVFVIAAFLVSTTVHAQWLKQPTTGIPRTADGKPDLTGAWSNASLTWLERPASLKGLTGRDWDLGRVLGLFLKRFAAAYGRFS